MPHAEAVSPKEFRDQWENRIKETVEKFRL